MTKPSLFEEKLDVDTERRRAFNRRCTPNTKEEQAAIRALKRLAKKWPKTLGLVHFGTGSSLSVVRLEPDYGGDALQVAIQERLKDLVQIGLKRVVDQKEKIDIGACECGD